MDATFISLLLGFLGSILGNNDHDRTRFLPASGFAAKSRASSACLPGGGTAHPRLRGSWPQPCCTVGTNPGSLGVSVNTGKKKNKHEAKAWLSLQWNKTRMMFMPSHFCSLGTVAPRPTGPQLSKDSCSAKMHASSLVLFQAHCICVQQRPNTKLL